MRSRLLVCLLVLCAGCSEPDAPAEGTRSFTDDLDRTVALADSLSRIITLAPSMTDLVVAAGAGDRLVGVSNADDNPAVSDSVTRVSALPVDFEAVAALEPDVILATDQVNNPRNAETFASLGIPTLFFSFTRVRDIPRTLDALSTVLRSSEGSILADSLRRQIDLFKSRTDTLSSRPRVLFLISDAPLYAFGGDSYVNEMIRLAGGRSITDSLQTSAPVLDEEFVLEVRPQVIIGTFGETYKSDRLLRLHPTWKHLPAVRENRIFTLPDNWVLRPSPTIFHGIRRMTELLHPDLVDSSRAAAH